MEAAAIAWAPPLGWAGAAAALVILAAVGLVAALRRRATWPRLLLPLAALPLLLAPQRTILEREPQRPLAIAIVDDSESMDLETRRAQAAAALARLRASEPRVEWRVERVAPSAGQPTRLQPALDRALAGSPQGRLGAVVLLTDGAVADDASALRPPPGVPVHALLAGDRDAPDRRLRIVRAPPFARVGETARITLAVDGPGEAVAVRWWVDAAEQPPLTLRPGEPAAIAVPVRRRGALELAFDAAVLPGELTSANNRALVRVNGVREGLQVLLVSGAPYPGGRVWRDLLKADGNVRLTQFTILRLPSSFDVTSPDELALIPFPVEQLFTKRLPYFDLVFFDRFALSDLIGNDRLARVADYVRAGGALLVASGPEFDAPGGLARTPVALALPARSTGAADTSPFRPALTAGGLTHPLTAPFAGAAAAWGRWPDMAGVSPVAGSTTLMTGGDGHPLLVIGEVGRGRAAMLASTGLWWWARAVDGGGPRDALLRRLIHWLMREPELDASGLEVGAQGRTLRVAARGMPAPTKAQLIPLSNPGAPKCVPLAAGRAATQVADGLYRIEAAGLSRLALAGASPELADPRARAQPLADLAEASDGTMRWLRDGTPAVSIVGFSEGAPRGAIGVRRPQGGAIRAARREPFVPPWIAWALPTAALAFSWLRERR